jgi:membrane protein DedA with SNARE-associated domain
MAQFSELAAQFLETYGLLAIFSIMLLKEIGIPVPIPADLIMLGAAASAAAGKFDAQGGWIAAFVVILIPMFIGGMVQFALAKGPGRALVYRIGKYIGLTQARLDKAMRAVRKGGTTAVTLGLTTPGLRIATVPASGLADLSLGVFLPGLVMGSAFFLGWHFALGFLGGLALSVLSLPPLVLLGVLVAVIVLGIVGWRVARRRSKGKADEMGAGEAYLEWADASCPACIAIALAHQRAALTEQNA